MATWKSRWVCTPNTTPSTTVAEPSAQYSPLVVFTLIAPFGVAGTAGPRRRRADDTVTGQVTASSY